MDLWEKLLSQEWRRYQETGEGFSDEKTELIELFGESIRGLKGKVLDIGCGVLPKPVYMDYADVEWYGIDPLNGEKKDFKFRRGVAENMPYPTGMFDAVVCFTSLPHMNEPRKVASQVYRVLKRGGVFVLFVTLIGAGRYQIWRKRGGPLDTKHKWGFREKDILSLFRRFNLVRKIVLKRRRIYFFEK